MVVVKGNCKGEILYKEVIKISSANKPEKTSKAYYIHCIIGFLIIFGFAMLDPIKPVTPVGMQVLGIFLSMIYLWSFGMATLVTFGLHVGILLPSCSPYAAVLLANKDWVEAKDVMKYGAVVVTSILVLYVVVGVPVARLLF